MKLALQFWHKILDIIDFLFPKYAYGQDFGFGEDKSVITKVQIKRNGQMIVKEIKEW